MHSLRRYKLTRLIEDRFKGDRGRLLTEAGISKGRLSQLLDPDEPFGDVAARNLETRLNLEPGFFDLMGDLRDLLNEKGIRAFQANNEALGAADAGGR